MDDKIGKHYKAENERKRFNAERKKIVDIFSHNSAINRSHYVQYFWPFLYVMLSKL